MNARHAMRASLTGSATPTLFVLLTLLACFGLTAGGATAAEVFSTESVAGSEPAAGQPASVSDDAAAAEPAAAAAPLAGIRLSDLDGTVVDLGSYLGKGPIVLDFWATWCKPCLAALPELNRLHADLAPRGLQLLGINEDGQRNAAKVKPFVKTQRFEFPVLLDLDREAQDRLGVAVLPTTMLLDSKGNILHTSFGYRPGEIDKLRQKIEPLLPDTKSE